MDPRKQDDKTKDDAQLIAEANQDYFNQHYVDAAKKFEAVWSKQLWNVEAAYGYFISLLKNQEYDLVLSQLKSFKCMNNDDTRRIKPELLYFAALIEGERGNQQQKAEWFNELYKEFPEMFFVVKRIEEVPAYLAMETFMGMHLLQDVSIEIAALNTENVAEEILKKREQEAVDLANRWFAEGLEKKWALTFAIHQKELWGQYSKAIDTLRERTLSASDEAILLLEDSAKKGFFIAQEILAQLILFKHIPAVFDDTTAFEEAFEQEEDIALWSSNPKNFDKYTIKDAVEFLLLAQKSNVHLQKFIDHLSQFLNKLKEEILSSIGLLEAPQKKEANVPLKPFENFRRPRSDAFSMHGAEAQTFFATLEQGEKKRETLKAVEDKGESKKSSRKCRNMCGML